MCTPSFDWGSWTQTFNGVSTSRASMNILTYATPVAITPVRTSTVSIPIPPHKFWSRSSPPLSYRNNSTRSCSDCRLAPSLHPRQARRFVIALYHGTLSADNMLSKGTGVLQVHLPLFHVADGIVRLAFRFRSDNNAHTAADSRRAACRAAGAAREEQCARDGQGAVPETPLARQPRISLVAMPSGLNSFHSLMLSISDVYALRGLLMSHGRW